MTEDATAVFLADRDRLFGIAYRMLGSVADAEDVVQDAWVRWRGVDVGTIDRPAAFLTTIVTRLCLDRLDAARARRESYVGPWLPEPLVTAPDVAEQHELAESVTLAFLVVLETLSPSERSVFLLHEVFGHPYAEIAAMVDRSEAACRQLGHRAREHVAARRPRFDASPQQRWRTADAFLAACDGGDLDALLEVLAEDVTLWSDGGGIVAAARRPIRGADRVARFLVGVIAGVPAGSALERRSVNGHPGAVVAVGGRVIAVVGLDVLGDAVVGVRLVVNPAKLGAVAG